MNLHFRLCILLAGFVYGQAVRAQITITSVSPTTLCAGSDLLVAYNIAYPGQVKLLLYLYRANSTDSVNIAQLSSASGSGNLNANLPVDLVTKTYTVGIKLVDQQATYLSPRSSEFLINAIPPSPTASPVSYCQNSTASSLSATASSGGTLNWYMIPTGGTWSATAPYPTTSSAGVFTYYVSQTVNGCESPRTSINVIVRPIPPPPSITASTIRYCEGSTAVALSATPNAGGTLRWYTTSSGGLGSSVSPTPPTNVPRTIVYYVSQTVNGCEGPRTSIVIAVMPLPAAPTITTSPVYCQNAPSTPLTVRASVGGTLNWYITATGGTASNSSIMPPTSTPGTFTYYVSQTVNGCEGPRASIKVTINPNPIVSINPSSATLTHAQTSLTLTATASVSNLLWSTSETTTSILVNSAGVYSVTATSNEGCTAIVGSTISQSEVYTIKAGNWDDATIWSINQLPTSVDIVRLRHPVSVPAGYQAQAGQVRYDEGGVLQMETDSYLKLRQ